MFENRIEDLVLLKFGKELKSKDPGKIEEINEYRNYLEENLKKTYTHEDIKSIKLS